jgi:hypothetical protein
MALTFERIATYTASSNQSAEVVFSSISQSYSDLYVTGWAQGASGTNPQLNIRVNGNTGSNYVGAYAFASGSNNGGGTYSTTNMVMQGTGGTTSTTPGAFRLDIFDYKSSIYKSAQSLFVQDRNGSGTTQFITHSILITSAITSLSINFGGAQILAGSNFSVYGILRA